MSDQYRVWGGYVVHQHGRLKVDAACIAALATANYLTSETARVLCNLAPDDVLYFHGYHAVKGEVLVGIRRAGGATTHIGDLYALSPTAVKTAIWPYDKPKPERLGAAAA